MDQYGAIAHDRSTGSVGVSGGKQYQFFAKRAAIRGCKANGGKSCEVVIEFWNQCMAVARPRGAATAELVLQSGDSRDAATRAAVDGCAASTGGQCEVVQSSCSLPAHLL